MYMAMPINPEQFGHTDVFKFDRLYKRALSKLKTAMNLDHSDFTEQWKKNCRENNLRSMVEAAGKKRCLTDLCFAEFLIDNFVATGL
ncbi:hypothetical protein [Ralstonia phage RP31]|uniref:Uncharacterized protein n=2 Tax=Ripduovirus RP12 TaxID=2560700 RepID=A0A1L7N1D9_9CAUD|nr:hypothetical protein FDH28_gp110 [Ralstonia phage RP12]BAW19084.1 hypothetical protein [Ralstonia phage RP12]BAW19370.1 hypothetical protein [Ralstonia phage RP31]